MSSVNSNVHPAAALHYLRGLGYPVTAARILQHTDHNGAPDSIRRLLEQLPRRSFRSPTEIVRSLESQRNDTHY